MSGNNPFRSLLRQFFNVAPPALHEQQVSRLHFLVFYILEDVAVFTAQTENVHVVELAEVGFFYPLVDQAGTRHQHHLRDTGLLELHASRLGNRHGIFAHFRFMGIEHRQVVIPGKGDDIVEVSQHVQKIVLLQGC